VVGRETGDGVRASDAARRTGLIRKMVRVRRTHMITEENLFRYIRREGGKRMTASKQRFR